MATATEINSPEFPRTLKRTRDGWTGQRWYKVDSAVVEDVANNPLPPCACQSSLALGIWSKPERIAPATIERLGPLVSKYLPK